MRTGMPLAPPYKTKAHSIFSTPAEILKKLDWTGVDFRQPLFGDDDKAIEFLFEMNCASRLGRIAYLRKERVDLQKGGAANHLRLVSVDGEIVNTSNGHSTLEKKYHAVVAPLRACLAEFGALVREP
jgi:hypothetical protein